ncbi:MAG: YggT family protein [Candidatus Margulisiibacteriota bacterium]
MMTLFGLVSFVFQTYEFLLLFRIVLTWLPHNANHPIIQFLHKITDPYLDLFRSLPLSFNGLDLSPVVAFFVLGLLKQLALRMIF